MGCAKAFLLVFNFIYLCISAAIIFVAAWLIKEYGNINNITTDSLVPCGILVGLGVLIFITALFGCCGTCRDNKCCLTTFLVLLIIVFALEITAGVLGYVYKDKARDFVNDGFVDAIKLYDDKDSSLDKAMDNLQKDFKCCGSKGPSDWIMSPYWKKRTISQYPQSCCRNTTIVCSMVNTTYQEGCLDKLTTEVNGNLTYIIGTAIGLTVLRLLGMIGACYLTCRCGSQESGYLQLEIGKRV